MQNIGLIINLFRKDFILKFFLLFLLYSIIPLTETFLLFKLGGIFGNYIVLAAAASTGLIGLFVSFAQVKTQLINLKRKTREGIYPGEEFMIIAGIISGTLLLLTPGFITDAVGFLLFFPFFRNMIGHAITKKFEPQLKEIYQYLKLYES